MSRGSRTSAAQDWGSPGHERVPRAEYPRPQMRRDRWMCLNGRWQFEVDAADSGEERGLVGRSLQETITVPFAPEAPLSGLGLDDFLPAVWYRRDVRIPPDWAEDRVLVHFQAVDYEATVWANGHEIGRHRGGSTPFTCELGDAVGSSGELTLVVRARDDPNAAQPRGKQTNRLHPYGSRCVRTTGIWQSVWLEPVGSSSLGRPRITPLLDSGSLIVEQPIEGVRPPRGAVLMVEVYDDHGLVQEVSCDPARQLTPVLLLALNSPRPWSPEDPFLYQLTIVLRLPGGQTLDRIESYAGLRSLAVGNGAVWLNGEPRFQRLVLDQGYWPDGGLTAPDDEALVRDITLAMEAGFDGARAHQRLAEERWLYHADRLGYLVWGEFPDWGNRRGGPPVHHFAFTMDHVGEWLEAIARDYSHPSIVGWCPLNETEQPPGGTLRDLDPVTRALFLATRAADRSRPVLDVSGYHHRIADADIWDCHDYEQEPEIFAAHYAQLPDLVEEVTSGSVGEPWPPPRPDQPVFVSEFGGSRVVEADRPDSGGYGEQLASTDDLLRRFRDLCGVLLGNNRIAGYAYTQLTDTYEERNGLFDANRHPKLALEDLAAAQSRPAAVEQRVRADLHDPESGRNP